MVIPQNTDNKRHRKPFSNLWSLIGYPSCRFWSQNLRFIAGSSLLQILNDPTILQLSLNLAVDIFRFAILSNCEVHGTTFRALSLAAITSYFQSGHFKADILSVSTTQETPGIQ